MLYRLRQILFFCVLLLGSGPGFGTTADQQRVMTAAEQAVWPAIGLVTYGPSADGAICTATLVAADLILTAAHCVSQDGVPMAADGLRFSAGWRDGRSVADRVGKTIILAKGAEQKQWSMPSDMALVVLDAPIDAATAVPLALQADGDVTGPVSFIGYRRDARQFAHIAENCRVRAAPPPVFGLSCGVVTGNSGSPVLRNGPDGWQIVGLVVSYGTGENGIYAFATRPGDDLRQVIAGH